MNGMDELIAAVPCYGVNNCWHFNIYEQNKFRHGKFYNLGARNV